MSKLTRACIALAAFAAFAVVPATAMAVNDATLQNHANGVTAVGTKILGTTTTTPRLTNANTETLVECEKAEMHGEVTTNSHTEVAGNITNTAFINCTGLGGVITVTTNVGNGTPWCLRTSTVGMTTDEFQVRGNSCAAASRSITFVLHTAIGQCNYDRANGLPVKGTYTTNIATGGPDLHVTHQEFKRHNSNFFCPSTGFVDFTMDLEETVGGTDLKLVNAT
jgi:hypothetical protein